MANPTASEIPRPFFGHEEPVFVSGKKPNPKAKGGILHLTSGPSEKDVGELRAFLSVNAPRCTALLDATVPLSALEHLDGVPFVVLAGSRKSFAGLGALPRSVRRLSIRTHKKAISLAELPADTAIEQLSLDAPSVSDAPPVPQLRTLGIVGMSDEGAAFVAAQPALKELALKNASIRRLPASTSLERLILQTPSKLASLTGLGDLPRLRFLRLDAPKAMKRLGSFEEAKALRALVLVSAHRVADLSDLDTLPHLEHLGIVMTKLDETPFLRLKGKLDAGAFQLKDLPASKRLLAHLGIPSSRADLIENRFFDH